MRDAADERTLCEIGRVFRCRRVNLRYALLLTLGTILSVGAFAAVAVSAKQLQVAFRVRAAHGERDHVVEFEFLL